jgi:branched-chain amino acid transport system substrate-binding protein
MVANAEEGDAEIHVAEWAAAREALLNGETINYEGASGPIEFDEHGDPSSAFFVLYRLVDSGDGTFEYDLSNTVLFP